MHRSRLSVLVIFAAAAACSTHDDSATVDLLSRDPSLVARLEADREPPRSPLPSACVSTASVATSSAPNKTEASELTRRAYDAELLGNVAEARSLLLRAIALDGTNMSAAYHLGRASESLGDRVGATSAYCRYLTLSPTTTESAEVRQRVMGLSQPVASAASGTAARNVSSPLSTRAQARSAVTRRAPREQMALAPRTASRGAVSSRSNLPSSASSSADGDVVTASQPAPSAEVSTAPLPATSPTPARTERRTTNRAQNAGIGAVAGAILGAATGRSVKSAMIGAAAGGILGTVVTHGSRAGG